MKKLFAILLTIVMVAGLSLTALAVPSGFVSSPSSTTAPELSDFESEDEDCTANLEIISFADRDKMHEDDRKAIEDALESIKNAKDLTEINEALANLAEELGINPSDLAISDLFSIVYSDCVSHDEHGNFDITLKPESAKNFVSLLRYNNGKWEMVNGAKVVNGHLVFNSDVPYPFAIVVNTSTQSSPQTGSNASLAFIMMLVSACGLAFVLKKTIIAR